MRRSCHISRMSTIQYRCYQIGLKDKMANRLKSPVEFEYGVCLAGCEEAKKAGLNKTGVYHLHDAIPTGKVYTEVNSTGTEGYIPRKKLYHK